MVRAGPQEEQSGEARGGAGIHVSGCGRVVTLLANLDRIRDLELIQQHDDLDREIRLKLSKDGEILKFLLFHVLSPP